jgi:hypothetical protein
MSRERREKKQHKEHLEAEARECMACRSSGRHTPEPDDGGEHDYVLVRDESGREWLQYICPEHVWMAEVLWEEQQAGEGGEA